MEFQETDDQQPNEQRIAIYSKWAILGFSIFFSPLIGGILLMLNLRSVGYKKEGTVVLVSVLAYYFLSNIVFGYVATSLNIPINDPAMLKNLAAPKMLQVIVIILILNIIGGGVLAEYIFGKYFRINDYERKSFWKPLLITLMILIPLKMLLGM